MVANIHVAELFPDHNPVAAIAARESGEAHSGRPFGKPSVRRPSEKRGKGLLGKTARSCHFPSMSLAELKRESAALRPEEQRELAAFLAVVRMKQSGEWGEATTKQASSEREGWVSLDEAKRQLGTIP